MPINMNECHLLLLSAFKCFYFVALRLAKTKNLFSFSHCRSRYESDINGNIAMKLKPTMHYFHIFKRTAWLYVLNTTTKWHHWNAIERLAPLTRATELSKGKRRRKKVLKRWNIMRHRCVYCVIVETKTKREYVNVQWVIVSESSQQIHMDFVTFTQP